MTRAARNVGAVLVLLAGVAAMSFAAGTLGLLPTGLGPALAGGYDIAPDTAGWTLLAAGCLTFGIFVGGGPGPDRDEPQ